MEKQWMWHNDNTNGVEAAIADFDDQTIQWFDEPGCACGGADSHQTFADFIEKGARFTVPPDDITEEMRAAILEIVTET